MSANSTPTPPNEPTDQDPFEAILEHEESVEDLAERDDRAGALARYMLALARDRTPDDRDAELAGLPTIGGDE